MRRIVSELSTMRKHLTAEGRPMVSTASVERISTVAGELGGSSQASMFHVPCPSVRPARGMGRAVWPTTIAPGFLGGNGSLTRFCQTFRGSD